MIIYDPKIAILLIAFNRSNIKQVFDRIKVVKPRRLYIAVDESTNDTQCKICKETTSIVSHIDWECQVFKLYQGKNQGYDKHCFHSISWFFEQEPEGIILEDDCVPSLSFFGYCTTLLKKFRNDERIGHISGSNYQFGKNRGDGTYYYSNLTHVSGWAGWRRVWQEHCLNENKYDLFNQLDYLSNLPSHAPFQYRWNRFFNIVNHSNEHFWEVKYAYTNLINNRLSIIPNKNLITKIAYYDKMPHAIKNHPFTNIKNEEIDHIVHPSFICPDIEADLYSQTKEYNTSFEELYMPKEYFYLKEHFVTAIRNNHIHPKIPQIIHQIYEDLAGPPPSLVEISQSWKELNPDWEYRFWNKNDIETFLKTYYPEFIPAYNAFPHNVQRWDAIRYLILYKFGGLYVDMDYECTENITQTKVIVFEITDYCNLKCKYCSLGDLYNFSKKESKNINIKYALNFLRYIFNVKHKKTKLTISFFGGEPLVNFPAIQQIIEEAKLLNKNKKLDLMFNMTTNATLIHKYIDFIVENNIELLISFDGNEKAHSYRTYASNNKNSFHDVLMNTDMIKLKHPSYFDKYVNFNAVLNNRNSIKGIYEFIYNRYGKIPRISQLSSDHINLNKKNIFDDIFHSRKISEKEFQKEGSDVLPIVSNRLIPFNESKKFLKHYSLNLYLSNTLYLLYDLIDSFPTGTCLPFQTRMFLNTHNNLLPCEKVSYKNFLGKVNDHVFINIPEIVQRYNSKIVHCKKVCQYCYGGRACSTCLLSLDNLDQLGVEEFVCPDFQNQKTFEDKLNRIFSYLGKCPSEFFQIINHLITE